MSDQAANQPTTSQKAVSENDNAPTPDPAAQPLLKRNEPPEQPPVDGLKTLVKLQLPALDHPAGTAVVDAVDTDAGTHPSYYTKVEVVDQSRLDLTRAAGADVPPAGYRTLRRQIEDTERLVRILFQDDASTREKLLQQLKATAETGLVGVNANIGVGTDNLQEVKDRIADEFPSVRGKLWWWNLVMLSITLAICAVASVFYRYFGGTWYPSIDATSLWPAVLLAAFLIPAGVIVGLFVEFVFRVGDDVPYEQLQAINPGRWKPIQRALNTLIVAYVFAAILGSGAFKVGIGSILLNDFITDQPLLSLAIGFVTGFAYPYVRDIVQQFRPSERKP